MGSSEQATDLEVELAAFLHNPPEGLGKSEHFWNIVSMLWGPKSTKPFLRHPWAERMCASACENNYVAVSGCGSCVAGHTRILNPITGEQPTIQELCETSTAPIVMTMKGPARAGVPFLKGREDLYRVTLRNGTSFESTASHRVLTPRGYVHVSDLRPDSLLLGYEPRHRQSISGNDLLNRARDLVSPVAVSSITRTGCKYFYDIQVPIHHHYFAEGSIHHNSGKTDFFAVWAIVNWLAAPKDTLVFCTSTSLKESGKRIWGSVKAYYTSAGLEGVGKLVESLHIIRTNDGSGVFNDKEGISCIAGEKKDEKDAIGKLIGAKNKRVFLIADELPELTEAILTAGLSNLALNPYFQLIALGNFKSIFDAFGVFARPKKGYGSITVDDKEWETEHGICLHLDGMKSPNITEGKDRWPGIYNSKNLANHRKDYGPDSAEFWRMCRSFPTPEGRENVLFSDVDFMRGDAHAPAVWLEPPTKCISADPAFTTDGDKFAVIVGLFGRNNNGLPTLEIKGYRYVHENISLTKAGEPRDVQTARQLSEIAREEHCLPENVGVDCSGPGGLAFGSILSAVWSSRYLPVKFGEKPSERLVSEEDSKRCDEAFHNKVTELWAIGRHFVRAGQIKGLPGEIAKELTARRYETVKGIAMKMKVESKRDMKSRVGFSPDGADAFLILVELCRERFGFTPGAMNGMPKVSKRTDWIDQCNAAHEIYNPANSYVDA